MGSEIRIIITVKAFHNIIYYCIVQSIENKGFVVDTSIH